MRAVKRTDLGLVAALALGLTCPTLAFAQAPKASDAPSVDAAIDTQDAGLSPGQFVWRPEAATAGPLTIRVSLPLQRAYVYRGGVLIGVSAVSTGRPGHETPTGSYTILQKAVMHHSNLYNDAPMPFMERLTWDGLALHAGHDPGRPASHGCVRLPIAFARALYGVTSLGATVVIDDDDAPDATLPQAPAETLPTPSLPAAEIALAPVPAAPEPAAYAATPATTSLAVTPVADRTPSPTSASVQAQ